MSKQAVQFRSNLFIYLLYLFIRLLAVKASLLSIKALSLFIYDLDHGIS